MALVVGILLALFVVDGPWEWAAVAGGGAIELGEAWFWWRWTHRRQAAVGVETLDRQIADDRRRRRVGARQGELWRAEGVAAARAGRAGARAREVDGLTLVVERA